MPSMYRTRGLLPLTITGAEVSAVFELERLVPLGHVRPVDGYMLAGESTRGSHSSLTLKANDKTSIVARQPEEGPGLSD